MDVLSLQKHLLHGPECKVCLLSPFPLHSCCGEKLILLSKSKHISPLTCSRCSERTCVGGKTFLRWTLLFILCVGHEDVHWELLQTARAPDSGQLCGVSPLPRSGRCNIWHRWTTPAGEFVRSLLTCYVFYCLRTEMWLCLFNMFITLSASAGLGVWGLWQCTLSTSTKQT